MKQLARTFILLCLVSLTNPAFALEFGSPVDCELDETCFIQQYVDHGAGKSVRDTHCGHRSYDGHKGTDFRLPDLAAMQSGVKIIAAAGGIVVGTRDGQADGAFASGKSVKKRECGNGVAIRHSDGWTTQYCHMRLDSVAVKKGDKVSIGQTLGLIGLSGLTEFPHLHFQVTKDKEIIDPFDGTAISQNCKEKGQALWTKNSDILYNHGGIMSVGIVDAPPDYASIKQSSPSLETFAINSSAMVFWAHFYGVENNDLLTLKLTGPNGGTLLDNSQVMTKTRAAEMRFGGRKRRGDSWDKGLYIGSATLHRDGKLIATRNAETVIP